MIRRRRQLDDQSARALELYVAGWLVDATQSVRRSILHGAADLLIEAGLCSRSRVELIEEARQEALTVLTQWSERDVGMERDGSFEEVAIAVAYDTAARINRIAAELVAGEIVYEESATS